MIEHFTKKFQVKHRPTAADWTEARAYCIEHDCCRWAGRPAARKTSHKQHARYPERRV